LKDAYLGGVVEADTELQQAEKPCPAETPAPLEQPVIDFLGTDPGRFADDVDRVQQFLQIHQADSPRPPLPHDDVPERRGGSAMPAPGVKHYEVDCGGHTLW